jgi:hypothetical protein
MSCPSCSDRHELVRRQALALLANLLMKDYVKWRGALFHRCVSYLAARWPTYYNNATGIPACKFPAQPYVCCC